MEQLLVWIALAAGGLGLAGALVRGRGAALPTGSARFFAATGLGLVGIAVLLSLLTMPPFSPGQTLAPGLALGAAAVLLGALAGRAPRGGTFSPALAWGGRFGAATCGVALLSLAYSSQLLDALVGFGLAAAVTALVVAGGLEPLGEPAADDAPFAAGAEMTALLAVTLAAATYLATYHRGPTGLREWQPLPALLTGAGALLLAVRGSLASAPGREVGYSLLVPIVPLGIVAWLVAQQLHGTAGFLWSVLAGFGVFGLIAWLDRTATGRTDAEPSAAEPTVGTGLITSLLVLGGAVLAFRELHGYGLALMVLAGFLVVAALEPAGGAQRRGGLPAGALLLGLLLALYRMHEEHNEYASGFRPDFLYYYVALVAGAVLPALLAEVGSRGLARDTQAGTALARLLSVLGASLLAPLAVWLLLGDRPQAALLVGVAVGAAGLWGSGRAGAVLAATRLAATLILLSAVPLTHLLAPQALRTRGQRLAILAAVAVVTVLPLLAAIWRERANTGGGVAARRG